MVWFKLGQKRMQNELCKGDPFPIVFIVKNENMFKTWTIYFSIGNNFG